MLVTLQAVMREKEDSLFFQEVFSVKDKDDAEKVLKWWATIWSWAIHSETATWQELEVRKYLYE